MATTVIAALVISLFAPLVRSWMWRVPFGLLSLGTVLGSFVTSLLTTLFIGAMTLLALRLMGTVMPVADLVSGVTATIGGVTLLVLSARRFRDVRGLTLLCQRVLEEDAREQAMASLNRLFATIRAKAPKRHGVFVMMATGPLTQAGLWKEAREKLNEVDIEHLDEAQQALRNQALATCELHFDDIAAAEAALADIGRPAIPKIEVWLNATEALLLALRGEADAALAQISNEGPDSDPSLRASHRIVRAHAFAANGDVTRAKEELLAIRDEAGLLGLQRATRPQGPASPIAQSLLENSAH